MNWYYHDGKDSKGPFTPAEFDAHVRNGTIQGETLVWNEGMANWLPYAQASAAGSGGGVAVAGGSTAICSECAKTVPAEDTVRMGGAVICAACKPSYVQKLREGVSVQGEFRYAGFWVRLLAYILDSIILGVVGFVLQLGLIFLFGAIGLAEMGALVSFAFSIGLALAYYGYFLPRHGATPGKMALGLVVVTSSGGPISVGRALGRYLGYLLNAFTLMIGFLLIAFDSKKRGLHDRICNTLVIYKS